jgi:hypothetical protein
MTKNNKTLILFLIAILFSAMLFYSFGYSSDLYNKMPFAPGRLIIKLKSNIIKSQMTTKANAASFDNFSIDSVGRKYGIIKKDRLFARQYELEFQSINDIYIINFPRENDINEIISAYQALPDVEYAEPDYFMNLHSLPNDSLLSQQWGLHNTGQRYWAIGKTDNSYKDTIVIDSGLADSDIGAAEVYDNPPDRTSTVIVAIIDTGVDLDNPELAGRIWINTGEIPGDNIDNDHNGYVDDYNGWDFSGDTSVFPPLSDNDPTDEFGHGTHCAGIVAALSNNNKGISGIVPDCRIMPLKFYPIMLSSLACRAIIYAANNGADVINMSFGAPYFINAFEDAIAYAHARGVVLCASSGNDGDEAVNYPAACPSTIAVGATDSRDSIAYFSTYGPHIKIAAPGQDILSLRADSLDMYEIQAPGVHVIANDYFLASGTSMAAPFVSGVAAYCRSVSPGLTPDKIEQIIIDGADDIMASGPDIYSGAGRVNLYKSLSLTPGIRARIESPFNNQLITGQVEIIGIADGEPFSEYIIDYGQGNTPAGWTEIIRSSSPVSNNQLGFWNTTGLDGRYTLRLRVGLDNISLLTVNLANSIKAAINYPGNNDTITNRINILGTAICPDFSHYIIEYSAADSHFDWHQLATSSIPTDNGKLAVWNGPSLPSGIYYLRLSVFSQLGLQEADTILFNSESIYSSGNAWRNSFNDNPVSIVPSYGDFNNDGINEIVVGTKQGLKFYSPDGSAIAPFGESLPDHDFRMPIPVGNLNGDAIDDLVAIGVDSSKHAYLYLFDWNGAYSTIPLPVAPAVERFQSDPGQFPMLMLRDIDGNGTDEILYYTGVGDDNRFFVYNSNGSLRMDMPATRPSLFADLNNDGIDEFYTAANWLIQYDLSKQIENTFDLCMSKGTDFVAYDISAADIDNDNYLELVVMGYNSDNRNSSRGNYLIFAFDKDLKLITGWPHDSNISDYTTPSSPLFGDIDLDHNQEYFISYYGTDRGYINGYHLDGTSYSNISNPMFIGTADPGTIYEPLLIDLNADSFPDLLACVGPDMYYTNDVEQVMAWDKNGESIQSWPRWPIITVPYSVKQPGVSWHTPAVGDINKDGFVDLIVTTRANDLIFINLINSEYNQATAISPCWKYNRRFNGIRPILRTEIPLSISPSAMSGQGGVADTIWYLIKIENHNLQPDSCRLEIADSHWSSALWNYERTVDISHAGVIGPGQSFRIWASVIVPPSEDNDYDTCFVIMSSLTDSIVWGQTKLRTSSQGPEVSIPFVENFSSSILNDKLWCPNPDVSIEQQDINEPSSPYYLALDGFPYWEDILVSRRMNLSGRSGLILRFFCRRARNPKNEYISNNLIIEYPDSLGQWHILDGYSADGPVVSLFQQTVIRLPKDAYHDSFRIRFSCPAELNDTAALWLLDDIYIGPSRFYEFSLSPREHQSLACYGDTSKYRMIIHNIGAGPDYYDLSVYNSGWPVMILDNYYQRAISSIGPIASGDSASVIIKIIRPIQVGDDEANLAIMGVSSSRTATYAYFTTHNSTADFFDDFSTGQIETSNWQFIDNCELACSPALSHSLPCAVRMGGFGDYKQNALSSRIISLEGKSNMVLKLSYLRDLGSIESIADQNLLINYRNRDGHFSSLVSIPSDGPDMNYFSDTAVILPEDACHSEFQFYIWSYTSKGKYVTWYFDDIAVARLTETDISPSDSSLLPLSFNLSQNYPNPFNGSTIIKYSLPRLSDVDISIYNILGQKVISLVAAMRPAGDYQINWRGIDWKGNPLASGIYFYCLKTDNYQSIKKMVLLK